MGDIFLFIMIFMNKFDIYKVDTKYINYLKQFQERVADPKDFGHTRPYVGILIFSNNMHYYFAPLTSKTNKPEFYCVRLYDENKKAIAGVRINNMIPIPKKIAFEIVQPVMYMELLKSNNPRDVKYGNLLKREVSSLKTEIISSTIYKKAVEFRRDYKYKPYIKNICLDFQLLEQKALEFSLSKDKKKAKTIEQEEELVR